MKARKEAVFFRKKYCSAREKESDFMKISFEEKPPPVLICTQFSGHRYLN